MANNEILKTIKINVNSSEYKALQKTLLEMAKVEKEINKLEEKNTFNYAKRKRELDAQYKAKKSIKNLTDEEKDLLDAQYKEAKKNLNIEKQKFKTKQELLALQKQLNKEERDARLKEARDTLTRDAALRKRQLQREEWENPDRSFLEQAFRYGGLQGAFQSQIDYREKQGETEVAGYEESIFNRQQLIESNKALIDNILSEIEQEKDTLSEDEISDRMKQIAALKDLNVSYESSIENIKDQISKSKGATKGDIGRIQALGKAAQMATNTLKSIGKVLLKPFKDLANSVKDVVTQMIDLNTGVATFNTQTSLITNTAAREQQMKYGLTSAQNYAFTQAKSMLNIQSDEDLMYMNAEQRERLLSYMEQYSAWYKRMEESGVLQDIQEMQVEFNELKQQLGMAFLEWVAANKETLFSAIVGIFEFVTGIAESVGNIMRILSWGRYSGSNLANKIDTNNTTNDNSKNTTININANTTNNNNGLSNSQNQADQFSKENFNRLAKQLVGVIGG